MSVRLFSMTGRPVWRIVSSGPASVAIAERDALGTTARVVAWPSPALRPVVGAVDRELERLDQAASRFRPDSELSKIHRRDDGPVRVSAALAEAVSVALEAARWTEGLVDPTVGGALIGLGYDRDFAELGTGHQTDPDVEGADVPGWQRVSLRGTLLHVPPGVRLDLGATAKGLGADRAAAAAHQLYEAGGVLVSLGGDIAVAGESPEDGWPVLIADDHRQTDPSSSQSSPTQLVRLAGGGLATSSILCRRWVRSGQVVHHIIDPRTGLPADGPWRTVSVAAKTCAIANAASTAAIISGGGAPGWLAAKGLAARLVGYNGSVVTVGHWPAAENGQLGPKREQPQAPPAGAEPAGHSNGAQR